MFDQRANPEVTRRFAERLPFVALLDVSDRRADAVHIGGTGTTVADYETNADYDADVPVVAFSPTRPSQRTGSSRWRSSFTCSRERDCDA